MARKGCGHSQECDSPFLLLVIRGPELSQGVPRASFTRVISLVVHVLDIFPDFVLNDGGLHERNVVRVDGW